MTVLKSLTVKAPTVIIVPAMTSPYEFKGDADLYGLGVRTGSYISWLTTVVAFHGYPDKTVSELDVTTSIRNNSQRYATI